MKIRSIATALLGVSLLALPAAAQTAAELLQKGIYSQETAGELDSAIQIYRQIVNSAFPQRDIAAQAQYRLVQSLIQKGDLAAANTEMSKLAKDYADWAPLIKNLASHQGPRDVRPAGFDEQAARVKKLQAALAGFEPDLAAPVTVKGAVIMVNWVNPRSSMVIEGQDDRGNTGRWSFMLGAPNTMVKKGMTRNLLKLGDKLTVTGFLAKDGKKSEDGSSLASARTLTSADGLPIFNDTDSTQ